MAGRLSRYPRWLQVPGYGVILVAFAVGGTLLGSVILCGTGVVPWVAFGKMFRNAVQVSLGLTLLFGAGGLVTGMLQKQLEESNLALRRKEEEERRARAAATEARLLSLESRVHPHFLFNAINSILSLIRGGSAAGRGPAGAHGGAAAFFAGPDGRKTGAAGNRAANGARLPGD